MKLNMVQIIGLVLGAVRLAVAAAGFIPHISLYCKKHALIQLPLRARFNAFFLCPGHKYGRDNFLKYKRMQKN